MSKMKEYDLENYMDDDFFKLRHPVVLLVVRKVTL
jgi:hypothetical protein